MVAFARSAMNRCSAGGIAWSSVPIRYQHGIPALRAGGPDGAPNAAPFHRPLRRGHDVRGGAVDVRGEGCVEPLEVEVEFRAVAAVRAGEGHRPDRRPDEAAFVGLRELLDVLALVGHPPV